MEKKPIKTEYRGTVFDSKSEAVFAKVLDEAGHEWVYHPEEHCGHVWDFLILSKVETYKMKTCVVLSKKIYQSEGFYVPLSTVPMLIEYKPSPPTETYIKELTKKMSSDPFESVIVWGNPWSGVYPTLENYSDCCYYVYPIFSKHDKHGWGDFMQLADNCENVPVSGRHTTYDVLAIEDWMVEKAMSYRFDLLEQ